MSSADYAELLGLYLGDGHITEMPRTQRLRIFLDSRHARVVAEARGLLVRSFPENRVGVTDRGGTMSVVWTHHRHLACLLPQHGPGKKHERAIVLESWQRSPRPTPRRGPSSAAASAPMAARSSTGRAGTRILSYEFRNRSPEASGTLFLEACELVGRWAVGSNDDRVRICRRSSVALLLEHVGIKE